MGRGGEGKAKGRPGGMVWFAKEKGAGGGGEARGRCDSPGKGGGNTKEGSVVRKVCVCEGGGFCGSARK